MNQLIYYLYRYIRLYGIGICTLSLGLVIFSSDLYSQKSHFKRPNKDQDSSSSYDRRNQDKQDNQDEDKPKNETVLDDGWSDMLKVSSSEKKKTCKKYEHKYISYYDKIYYVEGCKRKPVSEISSSMNIVRIDSREFSQIQLEIPKAKSVKKSSCKELNNRYVTEGYVYVYYVENCKLNMFPDWATYQAHLKLKGKSSENLIELDLLKYPDLKEGETYLSVVDQDKTIMEHIKNDKTDVIPLKKACKGIEGKFVSYVDKIYKIEKCQKREIDPEEFVSKHQNVKLIELSSNQWVSIPDGKPLN